MKKVGIITTFRQPNWGSVLQAYALQRVVSKIGYDVEVIDYKYPNVFHWERGLQWGKPPKRSIGFFFKHLKSNIACYAGLRAWPMMKLMNIFIAKEMKVSRCFVNHNDLHLNPPYYDIYLSGSDQIWNPNTMLGDMSYLFDFAPEGCQKISYASSFSCLSVAESLRAEYKKYLSQYTAISVRENNGKKVVKDLTGRDAQVVLDPTLLLDAVEWTEIASKAKQTNLPEKYILCYMLSYTFAVDEPMGVLLQKIQDKYNMPVIALKSMPKSFNGNVFDLPKSYNKGIPEFLYLIKNASIVVSSSFHGTAFSLNFGKPLIALAATNEDDRVCSILEMAGLTNQLVLAENVLSSEVNPYYDIETEQYNIDKLRQMSITYLKNALRHD